MKEIDIWENNQSGGQYLLQIQIPFAVNRLRIKSAADLNANMFAANPNTIMVAANAKKKFLDI